MSEAAVAGSTKERLLVTTSRLIQLQGLAATGVKQILAESGAQYSSLYHHFPGGKDQLAAAAIRYSASEATSVHADDWDDDGDVAESAGRIFDDAARRLEQTDFAHTCPIATVALETASTNEQVRVATAEVFTAWISGMTARFERGGIHTLRARELAQTFFVMLEGSYVLCRSLRSTEPILSARDALVTLVSQELERTRRPRRARNAR